MACIAGMVPVPLVIDMVAVVLDVVAGPAEHRPALFARLHDTGTRTAVLAVLVAGLAALFVVIKLCRLQGTTPRK
ncbi:MAG TPA: hypothetical protein VFI31_18795 [Pirellulales bacterium]|nr:hypothetical protein [Pirellulales bacterium]